MKVNVYVTEEVSNEERQQIAAEIDGAGGKKRAATRDEMKDYIWNEGKNWRNALVGAAAEDVTVDEPTAASDISASAEAAGDAVTPDVVTAEGYGEDDDFLS